MSMSTGDPPRHGVADACGLLIVVFVEFRADTRHRHARRGRRGRVDAADEVAGMAGQRPCRRCLQ